METGFAPCLHFNPLNRKGINAERRQGDAKSIATDPKNAVSFVPFVSIPHVSPAKSMPCDFRNGEIVSFRVSLLSPLMRVDNPEPGEEITDGVQRSLEYRFRRNAGVCRRVAGAAQRAAVFPGRGSLARGSGHSWRAAFHRQVVAHARSGVVRHNWRPCLAPLPPCLSLSRCFTWRCKTPEGASSNAYLPFSLT